MATNPVLQEISGLSPQAQQALIQAHHMIGGPAAQAAGSPEAAGVATAQPPAQIQPPHMQSQVPAIGTPPAPNVTPPRGTIQGEQGEQSRLMGSPAGVDSIHNPLVYGLAKTADVIGQTFAPRLEQAISGTEGHHNLLVKQAEGNVGTLQGQDQKQAQTANLQLQPQLKQAQEGLAEEKQHETESHHNDQINQQLAQHGFKQDEHGNVVPLPYEEMSEPQQAIHDYKASQEELAKATTDLREAQKNNIPSQLQMAQQRIAGAQQARSIAMQRLGLSEKTYEMRAHGTENGEALPGTIQTDQGPVGSAFQKNVAPTETEKNASGRASTMNDLSARIREGLKDPEILSHLGPIAGRAAQVEAQAGTLPKKVSEFYNDLKSYGAFQAGLHPVRGIGGLQYFDKIMGGLGQTPEELEGKLTSNERTAKSVQNIGSPKVAGGNTPNTGGGGTKEGDTKTNSAGDKVVFRGGKWGPA